MPSNQPIVLLREVDGDRYLPIWIGAVEATAIAFAQQGVVPARDGSPPLGLHPRGRAEGAREPGRGRRPEDLVCHLVDHGPIA